MIAPQPPAQSVGQDTFFVGDFDWPSRVERFDKGVRGRVSWAISPTDSCRQATCRWMATVATGRA